MSYHAEWHPCTNPHALVPGYWGIAGPDGFWQTAVDAPSARLIAACYTALTEAGYRVALERPMNPAWVDLPVPETVTECITHE